MRQKVFLNEISLLVFGLLCRHTVNTPITVGTHTSGAQSQGSPEAPGPMALPQWTMDLESYANKIGKQKRY